MCQKCTTSHFFLCCRLRSLLKQIAGRERGPKRTCRLSQRKSEKMLTHRMVMVRSPWDCRMMAAHQYLSGAWSPGDNLAIAARGLYDSLKSQRFSYDFSCLNDHLKSCVVPIIRARLLCSARTGIMRCYLRHVDRLTIF